MSSEHTHTTENHESNTIEDLTLDEAKTENVKGGYIPKATDVTLKRGIID